MPDCCRSFAREAERLRGERDDLLVKARDYEQKWYASNRALHEAWKERDRYLEALREIAHGKRHVDNGHRLGEYASMAMRFVSIAQKALVAVAVPSESTGEGT